MGWAFRSKEDCESDRVWKVVRENKAALGEGGQAQSEEERRTFQMGELKGGGSNTKSVPLCSIWYFSKHLHTQYLSRCQQLSDGQDTQSAHF